VKVGRPEILSFILATALSVAARGGDGSSYPAYQSKLNIPYYTVDGRTETLNAFLPVNADKPLPAIVDIHGGWWVAGDAATKPEDIGGWQVFMRHGQAIFSIRYRLGAEGGFPENIQDCRNAIRFIRKNAALFSVDPNRVDVCGGSAGGYLSLMVAMVPEDFDDGGPTPGLEGISAQVSGSFSSIPPTDFLRFWDQGPNDVITNAKSKITFRAPDDNIPNDARPHFRILFHGITPDTPTHEALYTRMCPIGHVRKQIPPVLICDGQKDPIVTGLEGKELYQQLVAAGAPANYWMTPEGGHSFPEGGGFWTLLDNFVVCTLKLDDKYQTKRDSINYAK